MFFSSSDTERCMSACCNKKWNRMLLGALERVLTVDGHAASHRVQRKQKKTLCGNVSYGSDKFTPDEAAETSAVPGKTHTAVQSLAGTELLTEERGNASRTRRRKGAVFTGCQTHRRWACEGPVEHEHLFNALWRNARGHISDCMCHLSAGCMSLSTWYHRRKEGLGTSRSIRPISIHFLHQSTSRLHETDGGAAAPDKRMSRNKGSAFLSAAWQIGDPFNATEIKSVFAYRAQPLPSAARASPARQSFYKRTSQGEAAGYNMLSPRIQREAVR